MLISALFFKMIDISNNSKNQQTIAEPVSINGIGLHSGADVTMKNMNSI